jgi:hypothetical protein
VSGVGSVGIICVGGSGGGTSWGGAGGGVAGRGVGRLKAKVVGHVTQSPPSMLTATCTPSLASFQGGVRKMTAPPSTAPSTIKRYPGVRSRTRAALPLRSVP